MNPNSWRRWAALLAPSILALSSWSLPATATAAPSRSHHRERRSARAAAVPPRLYAAARAQKLADRALVLDADRLARCLAQDSGDAARCANFARAMQRAGSRLARAERALTRTARNAHRRGHASALDFAAPPLSVHGTQLIWTRVAHIHFYLVERATGSHRSANYYLVTGLQWTPPPLPGQTAAYRVRAAADGAQWSNRASITYPSPGSPPSSGGGPGKTPEQQPSHEGGSSSGSGGSTQEGSSGSGESSSSGGAAPGHRKAPQEGESGSGEGDPQAAPVVTLKGETLSWASVANVTTYVLQAKVGGEAATYTEVSGTSVTPTPVPGASVHYSVRTAVEGSAWSSEVTLAYPAPKKEEPKPPSEPPPPSSGFEPGINSGTETGLDVGGAVDLGAKIVRIAFEDGTTPAQMEPVIAAYAEHGIRVAPLLSFYSSMPTQAQAQALAGWAKTFGPGGSFWAHRSDGQLAIRTIEFGNETSYGYQYGDNAGEPSYQARAQTYAVRLKEAAEAIAASGEKVGLLASAEDWTGDWMNGMFSAVPNLGSYVAGWVAHPYGTEWKSRIEHIVQQSTAHGASSSIPIDVTEWGLASDNGRCLNNNFGYNACMTYQQAAETMHTVVGEMRQMLGSRLGLFLLYQVRDAKSSGTSNEREFYFGLLQHEDQSKGAYTTAAKELLSS